MRLGYHRGAGWQEKRLAVPEAVVAFLKYGHRPFGTWRGFWGSGMARVNWHSLRHAGLALHGIPAAGGAKRFLNLSAEARLKLLNCIDTGLLRQRQSEEN